MFDCKKMPHRGIQFASMEVHSDRVRIHTIRHSEFPEGSGVSEHMRGTGASYVDGHVVKGIVEIIPKSAVIIQVRFTERVFVEKAGEFIEEMPVFRDWEVIEEPEAITLETAALRIVLFKETCALRWEDREGRVIAKEPIEGGKSLERIEVEKVVYSGKSAVIDDYSIDGIKKRVTGAEKVFDRLAYSSLYRMELAEDEAVYGLGQHEDGIYNYRHAQQYLYQGNMKVSIPTLVSSSGYAIHLDHHSLSTYSGNRKGIEFRSKCVEQLDFTFVYGPEFDQIVAGLRQLTGGMPMLPRWAYGFIQSKERYENRDQLIEVVQRHRAEGVPLDCVVLDWESWEPDKWGQKSFDLSRFPDPEGMIDTLHSLNARLMISTWPIVTGEGSNRQEMLEKGHLLANQATVDSANPEARALFWKHLNAGLFSKGVDAWWCDCTEPFEADWNGSFDRPEWERMLLCVDEFEKFMDPAEINVYSTRHCRGIYEGQRATSEAKRVVNLTRSAGPSQQRYGAITWSGDIEASWSRLRDQLADGLNFIVTGNPRWTFDIGAFFIKPGVPWFWNGKYPDTLEDMGYRELYTRWYQAGAFLPMFRSHGTDAPREIWNFGEPGTPFYDTIKSFTNLRYRLLPYIYSLSAKEVFEGYTLMRSLMFDFRADKSCREISDQFMLGPALMVCPVLHPMYWDRQSRKLEGVPRKRSVYLPQGCRWYDFWTGAAFEGGQRVELDAPLERIPLLVKEGSILPLGPVVQHSGEQLDADWDVQIYPGKDCTFEIYEDAGDGYAYESGEYCWTPLHWDDRVRRLTKGSTRGAFKGFTADRNLNVEVVQGN